MCKKGRWTLDPLYVREIIRFSESDPKLSNRDIANALNISHQSVGRVRQKVTSLGLTYGATKTMSDSEIDELLHPKVGRPKDRSKVEPDFEKLLKELKSKKTKHLTRQLLWKEYVEEAGGEDNCLSYSSFCQKLRDYDTNQELTMAITHSPGENTMVDYCGPEVPIYDRKSGEVIFDAAIFVMALGFSGYIFSEAHRSQESTNFLMGNARGFDFFGGATQRLIPDNLKSAVQSNTKSQTLLNRDFFELCNHFGCIPDPARIYKPRDKAKVEGSVYLVEINILAAIRHKKFYSLEELNCEIRERLIKLNNQPFTKMDGSRAQRFFEIEQSALIPLPAIDYEFGQWTRARVLPNYHCQIASNYYSVPFEARNQIVDIKITQHLVRIYKDNILLATHLRSNKSGCYVTDPLHRPESHAKYLEGPIVQIQRKAKAIGDKTSELIENVLARAPFPQNGIKTAKSILELGKVYGDVSLEGACAFSLEISSPTKASVSSILEKHISPNSDYVCLGVNNQPTLHANLRDPKELVGSK